MSASQVPLSDDELTAYLDGESDEILTARVEAALPEDRFLRARLASLETAKEPLMDGFALDSLATPSMPMALREAVEQKGAVTETNRLWHRARAAWIPAAMAASFGAGLLVTQIARPAPDWVEAIAAYQVLYVAETLQGSPQPDTLTQAVLAQARAEWNLDLDPVMQIEGLRFRRAQILGLDGELLLQIAFVDPDGIPFALCVTRTHDADRGKQTIHSHSLAASSWVQNGLGFVLIGGDELGPVSRWSDDMARLLNTTL